MNVITAEGIHKQVLIRKKLGVNAPVAQKIKEYLWPTHEPLSILENISFSIGTGERVALLGPNGAGKSSLIKILTGITKPSQGSIAINGSEPQVSSKRSHAIGVVFGHCSQLWAHLPVYKSFELLASIYRIENSLFRERLAEFDNAFGLSHLLHKLGSRLSLGERMRCEIVASLLHHPKILFLDEPTIGLDIVAKLKFRKTLRGYLAKRQTTLILTSHDLIDIEEICDRVIVLDKGHILVDQPLSEMLALDKSATVLSVLTETEAVFKPIAGTKIVLQDNNRLQISVDTTQVARDVVVLELLKNNKIIDLSFEKASFTDVIKGLYASR